MFERFCVIYLFTALSDIHPGMMIGEMEDHGSLHSLQPFLLERDHWELRWLSLQQKVGHVGKCFTLNIVQWMLRQTYIDSGCMGRQWEARLQPKVVKY